MSQASEYYRNVLPKIGIDDATQSISKISKHNVDIEVIGNWSVNESTILQWFVFHLNKQISDSFLEKSLSQSAWALFEKKALQSFREKFISHSFAGSRMTHNWIFNQNLATYFTDLAKIDVKNFPTTKEISFFEILKQYPNLKISNEAMEYISISQWQIKRLFQLTAVINEIDESQHEIDILQGPHDESKIIKYMIPTSSRENRLQYQQEIVNHILNSIPDEDFIDFMVKVYFEG